MSTDKQKFVAKLREETNYPFARKFINICYSFVQWCLFLAIGISIFYIIAGIIKQNSDIIYGLFYIISCLIYLCFWRIAYEMTILIIDIADSVNHSAYVNHATYLMASKRSKDT